MVRTFVAVCSVLAITIRFANAEVFSGTPVTFVTGTDWGVEYSLPITCIDGSYSVSLTIDVEGVSGESDLVLSIGTDSEYFSLVIAYDSGIWVDTINKVTGTLFVAPQSGSSFYSGDVSTMYTTDWRKSLTENVMSNWQELVGAGSIMGKKIRPLLIDIEGDTSTTTVTVTKGDVSSSVQFASAFPAVSTPTLFMATDAAQEETFTLHSIDVVEFCDTFIFDSNPVIIPGTHNWAVKYPLPETCGDANYDLSLSIDILALTDEADLILAIGTETTYFGAAIGYDGGLWVESGDGKDAMFATSTFVNGDVKTAYTDEWRTTIPGGDISNWTPLGKFENPLGNNLSPLIIDIVSDAASGTTTVTFKKGTGSKTMTYNSVFPALSTPEVYMGSDPLRPVERFELSAITPVANCAPTCETHLKTYIDECYCSGELGFDAKAQMPWIDSGLTVQDVAALAAPFTEEINAQTRSDMMVFAACVTAANFLLMSLMLCGCNLSPKAQRVHSFLVPDTDVEDNVALK